MAAAEIDFAVELHAGLGRVAKSMDGVSRRLDHLASRLPVPISFHGSGVFPSAGNLTIVCNPGPSAGKIWDVRSWAISGPDPTVALAGTAYVFVGTPGGTNPNQGVNWSDKTSTQIPVPAFYSRNQIVVRYPAIIYFVVTGGTANSTYLITGEAEESSVDSLSQLFEP